MKQPILILFLSLISFAWSSAQLSSVVLESAPQKMFDRSKLIPLDQSVPERAKPAKPVYTKDRKEYIHQVGYHTVFESSVGGNDFYSQATTKPSVFSNTQQSILSADEPAYYEHITEDGKRLLIPLKPFNTGSSQTFSVAPSKATYRIIERN